MRQETDTPFVEHRDHDMETDLHAGFVILPSVYVDGVVHIFQVVPEN